MARTVTLNFVGRDQSATKTINGIRGSVDRLRGTVTKFAGYFGASLAGAAVVTFFKDSVKAASDLAETTSKTEVVFGRSAESVKSFGRTAATALGMSQQQAMEAAATFGNLFVSMKIGQPQAAQMSVQMVRLAADLASFNNASPEETLTALRAGLVGEVEPLRRFGVNLDAASLKAEAMRMGLGKIGPTLSAGQKAQAAYSLIVKQTATAQGDFARTSGGLANQQRILAAQVADAQAKIGELLLPAVVAVAGFLNNSAIPAVKSFAGFLGDNADALKVIGVALGGAAVGWAAFTVATKTAAAASAIWASAGARLSGAMDTLRLVQMEAHSAMAAGQGRISAYSGALKAAGGGAGIFKKAMSGLSGVFGGPWGLAITGAITAVGIFAARNGEAEQRVEDLTAAIKADSGALGENTREKIVNTLQTEGMVEQAKKLGIDLGLLTRAAMGNKDAIAQINGQLSAFITASTQGSRGMGDLNTKTAENAVTAGQLQKALMGQNSELSEAQQKYKDNATMMGAAKGAAGGFKGAIDGVGNAAAGTAGDMRQLNTEIFKNTKAFRSDQEQAIRFRQDIRDLSSKLRDNGRAFFGNSAKALENRGAFVRAAGAVQDHIEELVRDSRWTDKSREKMVKQRDELVRVATKFGLSKKKAREYVNQLLKIPKKRSTSLSVNAKGQFKMSGLERVSPKGRDLGYAEGGLVHGPGGPRDDKIHAMLSNNEFVVNARSTRKYLPLLRRINDEGNGGAAGPAPPVEGDPPHPRYAKGGLVSSYSHRGDPPPVLGKAGRAAYKGWERQWMAAVRETAKRSAEYMRKYGPIGGKGFANALRWARSQNGKPYIWGGVGPRGYDCSGFQSAILNVIQGRRPYARRFTTHSFGSRGAAGLVRGRMSPYTVGVTHSGVGHMAGTLNGVNVESSGSRGVRVGGGARGTRNFPYRYGYGKADNGAVLSPGWNPPLYNGTGKPENLIPQDQAERMGPREIHIHVDNHGVISSPREAEDFLARALDNLRRKGRLSLASR